MTKHKHTPGPWTNLPRHGCIPVCLQEEAGLSIGFVHSSDPARTAEGFANAKLIAAATLLLADLTEAAAQLRKYETLHRAKGTQDSLAKAEVNAELASRFEQTIAAATA
ncbi:hypothetical protein RK21_02321 [Pseudomonas plecoglossicida]|uniref:hypothetical protein n=1 Tax=Pseudomonas plecoglossicida TaxID=70775 RepID=UPI0005A321F1|nr:hypothetical protein [Pseudomonas plecoglossicida]AJG13829.1 hypothetical protein RK21_02321 [Pseudomonas plecoglossicida]